ncbi:MAG: ParB/RepB/Spo0J family partition protein [Verrucomicrobiaceae bacterium]|nr:ParB/RepB/Spo0J family partition protein [Verrucomicrobiaceae bacterium]
MNTTMSNDQKSLGTLVRGRSLARVRAWEKNPRQGVYRGVEVLAESLAAIGLQDAIHVWVRVDGDYVLKGHRRLEAMRLLGWEVCDQVVVEFEDEAGAYRYLLQDHGHTDALDSWERCVAARGGVALGMTAAELAPAMGVKVERVQLWLDLEAGLPSAAKVALAKGVLSVNTAELLLAVEGEDRRKVTQLVLKDQVTGDVMSHGQAKAFIQATYVMPNKWRKEWEGKVPGLKRKFPMAEGYEVIPWAEKGTFVQGESGQPWGDFEFADGFPVRGDVRLSWGERAKAVGVPIQVVAAPLHKDELVKVVNKKLLVMAEAQNCGLRNADGGLGERGAGDEVDGAVEVIGVDLGDGGGVKVAVDEEAEYEDEMGVRMKVILGGIMEKITLRPAAAMTTGVWELLLPHLVHAATDVDAGAAEAWTGCRGYDELWERVQGDMGQRGAIRWALMLMLCIESDGAVDPLEGMTAMAGVVGE